MQGSMSALTVYQLDPKRFDVVEHLFTDATFDRVHVRAVFEGKQPGRILVDDPKTPTAALLCRTYEYYLTGATSPALVKYLADAPKEADLFDVIHDLAAARLEQTTAFYGLVPMNSAWHSVLTGIYQNQLEIIGRRAFRFESVNSGGARNWTERIPEGFSIHPVDANLARRIDEEAGELIGLFWGGYQRFGAHGFGSCAMHGEEIAGVCYTVAVSEEEANFGIETVERFRRRGIANVMTQACVTQAFERGLTPTWDCDLPNEASAALALKAGFTEYPSFSEFAFPDRKGPTITTGRWATQRTDSEIRWQRVSG